MLVSIALVTGCGGSSTPPAPTNPTPVATTTVTITAAGASPRNIVVDIGRASEKLKAIAAALNYRNLDEVEAFSGINTTTEFLALHVFDRMRDAIKAGELGPGCEGVSAIKVTLWESHIAWASYEQAV